MGGPPEAGEGSEKKRDRSFKAKGDRKVIPPAVVTMHSQKRGRMSDPAMVELPEHAHDEISRQNEPQSANAVGQEGSRAGKTFGDPFEVAWGQGAMVEKVGRVDYDQDNKGRQQRVLKKKAALRCPKQQDRQDNRERRANNEHRKLGQQRERDCTPERDSTCPIRRARVAIKREHSHKEAEGCRNIRLDYTTVGEDGRFQGEQGYSKQRRPRPEQVAGENKDKDTERQRQRDHRYAAPEANLFEKRRVILPEMDRIGPLMLVAPIGGIGPFRRPFIWLKKKQRQPREKFTKWGMLCDEVYLVRDVVIVSRRNQDYFVGRDAFPGDDGNQVERHRKQDGGSEQLKPGPGKTSSGLSEMVPGGMHERHLILPASEGERDSADGNLPAQISFCVIGTVVVSRPMQVRSPEVSAEQVAKWMRARAQSRTVTATADRGPRINQFSRHHPGFDFKNARESLKRARAKNDIDTIKPLRRLRRNQGAINEALVDCLSAVLAVNKQMASEIAGLSGEIAMLRQQVADNENHPAPEAARNLPL
jgi:hypothetical protein